MKTQIDNTQEQQSDVTPKIQQEQSTGGTAVITDNRPATVYQRKLRETMNASVAGKANSIQRKANNTGLPDTLKSGIENLSGYAMDDVKVHYNSGKPAQLQAHAYAQGTDIHLAPGQEKHLPHEAWHVVQQKQGRVKPTTQLKGKVNVNDNAGLEKEADVMGMRALSTSNVTLVQTKPQKRDGLPLSEHAPYQLLFNPHTPNTGEIAEMNDLDNYGMHEFIGKNMASQVVTGRAPNIGVRQGIYPLVLNNLRFLGGGTNKRAYALNNNWVLLTGPNPASITTEVTELLNIEQAGARIPSMQLSQVGAAPNAAASYVIPVRYYDRNYANDITEARIEATAREQMGRLPPDMQSNQLLRTLKLNPKTISAANRPNMTSQEINAQLTTLGREQFDFQNQAQGYKLPQPNRWGFIQQRISGAELKKTPNDWGNFEAVLLNQPVGRRIKSYLDLIRICQAMNSYGVWGDFQLLHEASTGHVYVFDPDPRTANSFEPLPLVEGMITACRQSFFMNGQN